MLNQKTPYALFVIFLFACGQVELDAEDSSTRKSTHEISTHFDYYNDPLRMDSTFVMDFDALPLQGQLSVTPWTDTYWPKNKGGIGYRWQTGQSHTYELVPYEDVLTLDEDEIAALSPTEKYDLYVGNRDYALTQRIRNENSAGETGWQGYCHGWTMASIHFEEPKPVVLTNRDGLRIPFGSSDIKALLTYFQGEVVSAERYSQDELPFKKSIRAVGTTCRSNAPNDPNCTDTNPAAFHVVLTNQVGLRKKAFGIDATTTSEKWNQPVHRYQTRLIERRAARANSKPGVVEEIIVETSFTYTAEIEPQWAATNFTSAHSDHEKKVTYRIDLDNKGRIIDGEWILLVEGGHFTLAEVYEYYLALDENGDGLPDMNNEQVKSSVWQFFDFPDYVWLQDAGDFAEEFKQAESGYSLQFNTLSTRRDVYQYLARLADIYEASIQ